MVRLVVLTLWLSACTVVSKDTPKLGEQVEAPFGYQIYIKNCKRSHCPVKE